MSRHNINRRTFLGWGASIAGSLALSRGFPGAPRQAHANTTDTPRFLFVVGAKGGASIVDSLLPVAASQVSNPELAQTLVAYPDPLVAQPPGSNIRCVRSTAVFAPPLFADYDITEFVARHMDDMAVLTVENSSVNHEIAQRRAVTGDGFDGGRTIMEAVASKYGAALPLANCNLARGGYIAPGERTDVPAFARAQLIPDPRRFALATHGHRGIADAPDSARIDRARAVRAQIEQLSPREQYGRDSPLRGRYREIRETLSPQLEASDLITRLMLLQDTPGGSLADFGLESSPDLATLQNHFPELERDALQTQAAIAYLLTRYGASCTVTIGPGDEPSTTVDGQLLTAPVAYDFSHAFHAGTQALMWSRILKALNGLIALLKSQPHGDGSMWDSSLIYVATDFGRTKVIPPGSLFQTGTGHDLNNGVLLISPLLAGNRVYGGVDPDTCQTYGFDLATGAPEPGSRMDIGHVYSAIAQALELDDVPTRHDMSIVLR